MFLTVHSTAAIVIAKIAPNPVAGFFAGFISHYILDAIPHGDENFFSRWPGKKWIKAIAIAGAIDLTLTTCWLLFLNSQGLIQNQVIALAAAVGSILPDVLNGLDLLWQNKILKFFSLLNDNSHKLLTKKTLSWRIGFLIQLAVFAVSVALLIKF